MVEIYSKFNKEANALEGSENDRFSFDVKYVAPANLIPAFTALVTNYGNARVSVPEGFVYGCALVVAGLTAGNNVTIHGYDYLGQRMSETFSTITTSNGVKAFKMIEKIVKVGTDSVTIATSKVLGVPYAILEIEKEIKNGVKGVVGTVVVSTMIDQTAITADPRGTYTLTGTYAAGDTITLLAIVNRYIDRSGAEPKGGLHGVKHFSSF